MFGNLDKTQADAWDINQGHQSERTGAYADTLPAGREGVENKDINGVVRWDFAPMQSLEFEAGYSRQNNLYAGDTQNTNNDNALVKKELRQRDQPYLSPELRGDLERRLG
jgi:ferric enterobactin receptor